MDKNEANKILTEELNTYRAKSYKELEFLIEEHIAFEIIGTTGLKYFIQIQIFWDDQKNGDIRVLGLINDDGWSAFLPMTDSFISNKPVNVEKRDN